MRTLLKIMIVIGLLVSSINSMAQTPGWELDPHWTLEFEDEFDAGLSNWDVKDHFDHWGGDGKNWVALEENAFVQPGTGELTLEMRMQSYVCPTEVDSPDYQNYVNPYDCTKQWQEWQNSNYSFSYDYTTGYVTSLQSFGYGYYEARIRLPMISDMNAAFWLYSGFPGSVDNEEIDIIEALYDHDLRHMDGWNSTVSVPGYPNDGSYWDYTPQTQFINTSNIHLDAPAAVWDGAFFFMEQSNYTDWCVYGLEYTSEKLIWYINGEKVREEVNPGVTKDMFIRLNIGGNVTEVIPAGTSKDMFIDYVRYYKWEEDCEIINVVNYNFAAHDNKVKQSIDIGSPTSSNSVSGKGVNAYLRAKNHIQINGEFTVPLGKVFSMYPNDCD